MEQLMRDLDFPMDAVGELLDREKELKAAGFGRRLEEMAAELMEGETSEERLRKMLADCEALEKETGVHRYTLDLFFLLYCAQILRDRYRGRGFSDQLFVDSMMDLKWKLLECRQVYGVNGIFVGHWYGRFFDMTRFALGRLQFETEHFEAEKYEQDGILVKKGDTVLNMHVPSSGPLTSEKVDEAFQLAAGFYRDLFPDGVIPFVIDSWLLDPDLMKLLPEGNTKEFTSRFCLLSYKKHEVFADGWRVFGGEWEKTPDMLPRKTRLQTAVADYLAAGGKLGEGYGILIWREKQGKQ